MFFATKQLLAQSSRTEDQTGITLVLVFAVWLQADPGATDIPIMDQDQFLTGAALAAGIPRRGDYCKVEPTIQADTVVAKGKDNQAEVTVTYRRLNGFRLNVDDGAPAQLQMGGGLEEVETSKDVWGDLITLTYTLFKRNPDGTIMRDASGNGIRESVATVETGTIKVQVPVTLAIFTARRSYNPLNQSRAFRAKVNSGIFLGDPPGTWLCKRIEGQSDDGGRSYPITYEFQYREEGWYGSAIFHDPYTNKYVTDPTPGLGSRDDIENYKPADFDELRLGQANG